MEKNKLFLLSVSEVEKYLPYRESRICLSDGKPCLWWLRSPGYFTSSIAYMNRNGYLDRYGIYVGRNNNAVCPALHLNPDYLKSLERTEKGYVEFGNMKWLVLNEDTGLLLSKEAVARHLFDAESNNYEQSEIRTYMNGELLNELFTEEEQKLIVDTVINGEESNPSRLIELDSAKQSDLISRKEVLSILKNVFDEYRMSYGEQYNGFAAAVPKAIKAIPSVCVTKTLEDAEAMKEVCEPEYLGENHLIGCRDGRCSCGNIVKSFQNFCDACGNQLEWGNVWGQN